MITHPSDALDLVFSLQADAAEEGVVFSPLHIREVALQWGEFRSGVVLWVHSQE